MIKMIYCVHDVKSTIYGAPFLAVNEQTAIRSFARAANDLQSDIAAFPADFNLFAMGKFDDESGEITVSNPVFVVSAQQLVKINQEV